MIDQFLDWIGSNRGWLNWVGFGSLIMLILSLIIVPIMVVKMQPDYFMEDRDEEKSMKMRHPVLRFLGKLLKNLAGGLLIVCGGVLSIPLIPGQGLLTILIGLAIMDFPGKRKLELRLVVLKPVRWAIQKLREKAHKPPLELPSKGN